MASKNGGLNETLSSNRLVKKHINQSQTTIFFFKFSHPFLRTPWPFYRFLKCLSLPCTFLHLSNPGLWPNKAEHCSHILSKRFPLGIQGTWNFSALKLNRWFSEKNLKNRINYFKLLMTVKTIWFFFSIWRVVNQNLWKKKL